MSKNIKIVFVGDSKSGKTCIIRRFHTNIFEESYDATTYDVYEKFYRLDDRGFNLRIEDTAGQPDYQRLRPLQYQDANIFVICFSLADEPAEPTSKNGFSSATGNINASPSGISFNNVSSYWYPEVCHFKPDGAKIILLGNKRDLRDDPGARPNFAISSREGKKLAKSLKIDAYCECSAKTGQNVFGLFDLIVDMHLQKDFRMRRRRRCNFL